jgi:hypothetical protein
MKNGKINKVRYQLPTRHILIRLNISPRPLFPSTMNAIRIPDKIGAASIANAMFKGSIASPRKKFGPATKKLPSQAIVKARRKNPATERS